VQERVTSFQAGIVAYLRACDPTEPGFSSETLDADYDALREQWHDLKGVMLEAAGRHQLRVRSLNAALEALRGCLRMAEQLAKAAARLRALGVEAPAPATPADPPPEQPAGPTLEATGVSTQGAEPESTAETPAVAEPGADPAPENKGAPGA
jgi:hypothetical protein